MSDQAMDKLDRLVKRAEAGARKSYRINPRVSLPPTFIALTSTGERLVIATPYSNEAEKAVAHLAVRHLFRERGVVAYAHVAEAWAAKEEIADAGRRSPAERPGRYEILVVVATDGMAHKGRMFKIVRGRDGGVRRLVPQRMSSAEGAWGGRMFNLLNFEA